MDLTLPSGKVASIKDGTGRDMLNAQRKARDTNEVVFGLIAELTTIDGSPIVLEDVLDMPLSDVLTLQGALSGNLPQSLPNTSSTSASSQVGA